MSYFRWFRVTDFQTKYQGFKLAQYITDPIPGQKIMTKELGEEVCLGQYKLFMDAGLMQNMPYYQETLLVEVDGPNGKLKIQDEPVIVTQHYQTEVTSFVVAGQV
jgi:phage tail sheath gpL-like